MWTDPHRIYAVTPFLSTGNTDCLLTATFSSTFHPGFPPGSQRHHLCLPSVPPASGLVVLPALASAVSPVSSAASIPSISLSLLSLERRTTPGVKHRAVTGPSGAGPLMCPAFLTLLLPAPPVHLPVLNLRGTEHVTGRAPLGTPRAPLRVAGWARGAPAHLRALGPLPHAALCVRHLPRAAGRAPAPLIGRRVRAPPTAGRSPKSRGRCSAGRAAAELSRVGPDPRAEG